MRMKHRLNYGAHWGHKEFQYVEADVKPCPRCGGVDLTFEQLTSGQGGGWSDYFIECRTCKFKSQNVPDPYVENATAIALDLATREWNAVTYAPISDSEQSPERGQ